MFVLGQLYYAGWRVEENDKIAFKLIEATANRRYEKVAMWIIDYDMYNHEKGYFKPRNEIEF